MTKIYLHSRYENIFKQFEFTRTAIMNAGDIAEVYWDGDANKSWYPTYDSVYAGQINCLVSVINQGSGTQVYGASNVEEDNILFEYVSGISTIAHIHQYFKHADTNMNGTWSFSVNPVNQGIKITWTAPSGANNTTFKMRCLAKVNEIKL